MRPAELELEKDFYGKFPERFNALRGDAQLDSIAMAFGVEVFRRSSVLEGFEGILKKWHFSGQRCVEIGTCKGLTAIVLARYFREVVTIDIEPDEQRKEIAAFAGVKNVRFVTVTDNFDKAAVINGLTFDAAYCDGDHARDTTSDWALTKRGGRILFHEFWEAQVPVKSLIDMLIRKGEHVRTEGKFALWTA